MTLPRRDLQAITVSATLPPEVIQVIFFNAGIHIMIAHIPVLCMEEIIVNEYY